ncbi:MAG: hypothetical protein JJU36_06045 [Phycisphaeraceae bacterium]|nr:hypothetical protein [Phycisphaeraceae bacterium]
MIEAQPASDCDQAESLRVMMVDAAIGVLSDESADRADESSRCWPISIACPLVVHLDLWSVPGKPTPCPAWYLAMHLRLSGRTLGWMDLGDGLPMELDSLDGPVPVVGLHDAHRRSRELDALVVEYAASAPGGCGGSNRHWPPDLSDRPPHLWLTLGDSPGAATHAYETLCMMDGRFESASIGVLMVHDGALNSALWQLSMFRGLVARSGRRTPTLLGIVDSAPGLGRGMGPGDMAVHRCLSAAADMLARWLELDSGPITGSNRRRGIAAWLAGRSHGERPPVPSPAN